MTRDEVVLILKEKIRFSDVTNASDNLSAFCPFHKGGLEKTPAFYVYVGPSSQFRQTGTSYCHVCGEGWALPALLRKLGMPNSTIANVQRYLESVKPTAKKKQGLSFEVPVLPEAILGMFEFCPLSLVRAGFTEEVLQRYEIGFDRTRRRIIFPLRDHLGNLVGLSGRTVVDDYPRYKIYKQELEEVHPHYELHKGRIVWGLNKFYEASRYHPVEPVVICEGFKAAMWVAQAGYPYVVALLGKSLSLEQQALLTRVANRLVLFLDNDDAGKDATRVVSKQLRGADVRVGDYGTSDPVSPDDLSPEHIKAAIEGAVSPTTLRYQKWQSTVSQSLSPSSTPAPLPSETLS